MDFLGSSKDAAAILDTLSYKGDWEGDLVDMRRDGETINIHLSMALVYGEDDEPIGIIASYIDITERKKAADELKKNEARLQSLIDLFQHETQDIQDLQHYAVNVAVQLLIVNMRTFIITIINNRKFSFILIPRMFSMNVEYLVTAKKLNLRMQVCGLILYAKKNRWL